MNFYVNLLWDVHSIDIYEELLQPLINYLPAPTTGLCVGSHQTPWPTKRSLLELMTPATFAQGLLGCILKYRDSCLLVSTTANVLLDDTLLTIPTFVWLRIYSQYQVKADWHYTCTCMYMYMYVHVPVSYPLSIVCTYTKLSVRISSDRLFIILKGVSLTCLVNSQYGFLFSSDYNNMERRLHISPLCFGSL